MSLTVTKRRWERRESGDRDSSRVRFEAGGDLIHHAQDLSSGSDLCGDVISFERWVQLLVL